MATQLQTRSGNTSNRNSRRAEKHTKSDAPAQTAKAAETLAAPMEIDPALQPKVAAMLDPSERPNTTVSNIFAAHAEKVRGAVTAKLDLLDKAKKALGEAHTLYEAGGNEAKKADALANDGARWLYQARSHGLLSSDELTGTLGKIWGFKQKADGSPSKTPQGQGEAIRKRVVRLASANDFLVSGDGGRFFEGMDPKAVQQVVAEVNDSGKSIFTAYDDLGKAKREGVLRVDPAYNPATISKMVEKLAEAGAAGVIARSPALIAAYAALIDTLNIVGAEAARIAAKSRMKAANPGPAGAAEAA